MLCYQCCVDSDNEEMGSCKPQQAHTILGADGMKDALDGKLLISILAGVTISQLSAWVLPSTKVVRAMPNTPSRVRILFLIS
jgi:pyrroline-5-carboxylate reductase